MSRASRARRIAAAAAYGSGGAVGATGAAFALLKVQARWARRKVGDPRGEPFAVDGRYGTGEGGALRMVVLGDSGGAGLGADEPAHTPAVIVAEGLAAVLGRPVELTNLSVVGAQTADLHAQVDRAVELSPHLAFVIVGANDVTHTVPPRVSVQHLDQVVRHLVEAGAQVIVGTCPDLGTVRPVPNPLRLVARTWSRTLAAAQAIAAVEAGGRAVSLGDILGPEFDAAPGEYFSEDRFHPSSVGYRRLGEVLLPSACAALGIGPEPDPVPDRRRGEHVAPIAVAAAEAAGRGGTEIVATSIGGRDRGTEGRWAVLRHRIPVRRPVPPPDQAAASPDPELADQQPTDQPHPEE